MASLGSAVFAVTRESKEWIPAARRQDELVVWGIGCHPGITKAITDFDRDDFERSLDAFALVGEVGLDGKSRAPMSRQREVLDVILEAVRRQPRLVSLHSVGATGEILDTLERHPQAGAILHWWRGSAAETQRAIEIGCFFSLNGAEAKRPKVLRLLPPERVLTETDFPHSRRADPAASKPGSVETIEAALENAWSMDRWGVRRQLWINLKAAATATGTLDRMPRRVRRAMLAAGSPG